MLDFHTKICGIRGIDDVKACVAAGADCIGLNFYPESVRYVDPNSPLTFAINQHASQEGIVRVGLFVNGDSGRMIQIAKDLSLDAVQLHGDETIPTAQCLLWEGIPIIRAIRLPTVPLTPAEIDDAIGAWSDLDVTLLLDADAGAAYGGGGRQLDWPSLAVWSQAADRPGEPRQWILAGGLDSENVATACRTSTATRVDVASGVESVRGVKSPDLIQKFVAQYRAGGVDEIH